MAISLPFDLVSSHLPDLLIAPTPRPVWPPRRGENTTKMNYGEEIKKTRLKLKYCQDYCAAIIGVSQPEYSKIETGKRRIKSTRAKEIIEKITKS